MTQAPAPTPPVANFDRTGTLVGPGDVRDQYVNTTRPPASTAVEVRRLVFDDLLIEVEAVATVA